MFSVVSFKKKCFVGSDFFNFTSDPFCRTAENKASRSWASLWDGGSSLNISWTHVSFVRQGSSSMSDMQCTWLHFLCVECPGPISMFDPFTSEFSLQFTRRHDRRSSRALPHPVDAVPESARAVATLFLSLGPKMGLAKVSPFPTHTRAQLTSLHNHTLTPLHNHTHTHAPAQPHTHTLPCTTTHAPAQPHTHTHTHSPAQPHTHTHTLAQPHTLTHTPLHNHTHTHACTTTHTHAPTQPHIHTPAQLVLSDKLPPPPPPPSWTMPGLWGMPPSPPIRYSFITIGWNYHFSSKTTLIENYFHPNHFHRKTLSSKTTFIKNHFHPKPFSSEIHFHQNISRQTRFRPRVKWNQIDNSKLTVISFSFQWSKTFEKKCICKIDAYIIHEFLNWFILSSDNWIEYQSIRFIFENENFAM